MTMQERLAKLDQPTLRSIPAGELHVVWPTVLIGLRRIERRSASHWIPEDIYTALRSGQSALYMCYVDAYYVGFVILTPTQGWDGKVLHIWCAYNNSKHDVLSLFIPELEKLGHSIGARRLTFWGPAYWERKIRKHGFVPAQTEFVKEL